MRLLQGVVFLAAVAGVSVAVVLTRLTVGDVFASILALVPTGWGLLSVSIPFCVCALRTHTRFALEIVCSLVINGNGNIIHKVI